MKNNKAKFDRKSCPDEIQINRYVLHQCTAEERKAMERHLVQCPLCRSDVILLVKSQSEIDDAGEWEELPERLYSKGMDLVRGMIKSPVKATVYATLEIVLRFIHDQWEIIKHTGVDVPHPVLASRGGISQEKAVVANIVREFDGFRVEVDIKGDKEGTASIRIRVTRAMDGSLEQKVQFTLRDEEKKRIIEEAIRDGDAPFEGLTPGKYSIEVASQERVIGMVSLDLRTH
jgi:hypothetical protein